MANQFVNLPVPAANGAGAAVDTSGMGATKTILVGGPFQGSLTIEFATDDAATLWAPVPNGTFVSNPGRVTIDLAARWMRASMAAYKGGAANADVGSSGAGAVFVALGPASVSIGALPAFKTVNVSGACNVEVSEDGVSWSQAFSFQNKGSQSAVIYAEFARVTNGVSAWIGGANQGDDDGGGGFGPVLPVGTEKRIYARTTGSDTSGNGSLTTPYRTLARAVQDIPQVIQPNLWVIVDITGLGTEVMPDDFMMPPYVAAGVIDFDFAGEFFFFRGAVNIQADPELVPMTPVSDATIAAPGDIVMTTDPITGRITLTLTGAPRADWGANALKGRIVAGAGGAFETARIAQSDTTFIVLTRCDGVPGSSGMITTPIRIMRETAEVTTMNPTGILRESFTFAGITTATVNGIVFREPIGAGLGLYLGLAFNNSSDCVTQLCTVYGIGCQGSQLIRNQGSYYPPTVAGFSYADVSFFGMRSCLREDPYFEFDSTGGDFFCVENTIIGGGFFIQARAWPGNQATSILARTSNFDGLGTWDRAFDMSGGSLLGRNCRMDNYTDALIATSKGAGFIDLASVVGSGNAVGVIADNNNQVQVDLVTNNPATGLLGTAGADYKVGSLAAAAWPGIVFNTVDPATFTRIYGV